MASLSSLVLLLLSWIVLVGLTWYMSTGLSMLVSSWFFVYPNDSKTNNTVLSNANHAAATTTTSVSPSSIHIPLQFLSRRSSWIEEQKEFYKSMSSWINNIHAANNVRLNQLFSNNTLPERWTMSNDHLCRNVTEEQSHLFSLLYRPFFVLWLQYRTTFPTNATFAQFKPIWSCFDWDVFPSRVCRIGSAIQTLHKTRDNDPYLQYTLFDNLKCSVVALQVDRKVAVRRPYSWLYTETDLIIPSDFCGLLIDPCTLWISPLE